MKKILKLAGLVLVATCLEAKVYLGVSLGTFVAKSKVEMNPTDPTVASVKKLSSFSKNHALPAFGIFAGYNFQEGNKVSPMLEADFQMYSGKITGHLYTDPTSYTNNCMATVKQKFALGITPMGKVALNDHVSGLFGIRFNVQRQDIKAYRQDTTGVVPASNTLSKNFNSFGFEPTIGAAFAFNKKVAMRLTVGYNFLSKKEKAVGQFLNSAAAQQLGTTAKITSVATNGVTIKTAIVYSF